MAEPRSKLAAIVVAAALAGGLCTAAQAKPAPKAAAAKAGPANPRDFSGVWMNDNTLDEKLKREGKKRLAPGEGEPTRPADRPLTPEYEAIYQKMQADKAKLAEGAAACTWPGVPTIMTYPYPFEMLHTLGRITMLFEADSQVRRIWLNRSKHLDVDDLDPSYNGDSIGRWEGNTLVVDTIGFNTDTTVRGLPHSEDLHIVERIHYVGPQTIEDEITLTDPKAFTKPIVQKVVYSRRPDWRIREYSCNENNRDTPDASGQRAGGVVK